MRLWADAWTRRSWVRYLLSAPHLLSRARRGARFSVAKKLVYDIAVERKGVIVSVLRDILGLKTHTSERVVELPVVEQLILREFKRAKVLEIGSGDSPLLLRLAGKAFEAIGIDIHRYPYSQPGLEFAEADALLLPFRSESIDVAFAISAVEHIGLGFYGDRRAANGDRVAVEEIRRVLKPNGKLIVTVPFGCQPIPNFERVYDSKSIHGLLAGLEVLEEFYWVYDGRRWTQIPKEEASRGPPLRENGTMVSGVIIMMAARP